MTDRRLEIALERLNREFGQPIRGELSPTEDELSAIERDAHATEIPATVMLAAGAGHDTDDDGEA